MELPGGLHGQREATDGVFDGLDRSADQASREDMNTVSLSRARAPRRLGKEDETHLSMFSFGVHGEEKLAIVDT